MYIKQISFFVQTLKKTELEKTRGHLARPSQRITMGKHCLLQNAADGYCIYGSGTEELVALKTQLFSSCLLSPNDKVYKPKSTISDT